MGVIVLINNAPFELPQGANLADAVRTVQAASPFAVAVNMQFIPSSQYEKTALQDRDSVEIIRPVTGG